MNLEMIYQDRHLVAVSKPAGLLSVPGRGEHKQDCVVSRLQTEFSDVRVVHRLDCHTSGIMLLAIGVDMQRQLSRLFHDREIKKTYIALVDGEVGQCSGIIDIPLRADPQNRPLQVIDYVNGKHAQTQWRLLRHESTVTGVRMSRLLLRPITGRTHQLRVHCKALGHPVTGDVLYNGQSNNRSERMMLHAEQIEFIHPFSGELMRLQASCGF